MCVCVKEIERGEWDLYTCVTKLFNHKITTKQIKLFAIQFLCHIMCLSYELQSKQPWDRHLIKIPPDLQTISDKSITNKIHLIYQGKVLSKLVTLTDPIFLCVQENK